MKCKYCGEKNSLVKKTCTACGAFLEGYTFNNVSGAFGYRKADGFFIECGDAKINKNKLIQQMQALDILNKEE